MIFINNKYTDWYTSIINKAKDRTVTGYTEKHHIIPSSLGGSNSRDNTVRLTAKEHYVCHHLLTKMLENNDRAKMVYALWMMNVAGNLHSRVKMTSTVYDRLRKEYSELVRVKRTGCPTPEYVREKIRQKLKGKTFDYMKKPKSALWYARHAETHNGKSNAER